VISVIEIYLFINPIGNESMLAEKQTLAISENDEKNFHFRFIPVVNMRSIKETLLRDGIVRPKIELLNHLFEISYSAALDLKAIQLQGRKKGREFLLTLQEEINTHNREYGKELVLDVVNKIGANFELFCLDRQNDLVKRAFISDQQLAREMGVRLLPSAVAYNFENDDDAMLFEDDLPQSIAYFYQQERKRNTSPLKFSKYFSHHNTNLKSN
jgi:hypothetical protein